MLSQLVSTFPFRPSSILQWLSSCALVTYILSQDCGASEVVYDQLALQKLIYLKINTIASYYCQQFSWQFTQNKPLGFRHPDNICQGHPKFYHSSTVLNFNNIDLKRHGLSYFVSSSFVCKHQTVLVISMVKFEGNLFCFKLKTIFSIVIYCFPLGHSLIPLIQTNPPFLG